jgi:hypothetical protein
MGQLFAHLELDGVAKQKLNCKQIQQQIAVKNLIIKSQKVLRIKSSKLKLLYQVFNRIPNEYDEAEMKYSEYV